MIKDNYIFVFGSNLAGRHGKGAAKTAYREYGALYGKGIGFVNRSYAIPTKDKYFKVLSLDLIQEYVNGFIGFAALAPYVEFKVTRIGTGYSNYKDEDIAPMFKYAPDNCLFDTKWKPILGDEYRYWGSYE